MERTHEDFKTLTASYVLGALPEEELPEVRRHIAACEECLELADSLSAGAASLALAVEPVEPPAGFKARVLERVAAERPATEGPGRPASWYRRLLPVAALLLITAIVVVAVFRPIAGNGRRHRVDELLASRRGIELEGEGAAKARIVPSDGGFTLAAADLDEPRRGRVYQLWLIDDKEITSGGTFLARDGVALVRGERSLRGVDAVAVTIEPEGGSPRPTGRKVIASA